MSKTKSYNQIIFLTTLSVYFGLVLVGASPQVLAQAALTNKFEIKDQIEQKDDLDKKPDKDVEIIEETHIAEAFISFFEDVKKLENVDKLNLQTDFSFSHQILTEEYETTAAYTKISNIKNVWLQTAISELISNSHNWEFNSVSDYLPNCKQRNCRQISVSIDSNLNDLTLKFGFKKSNDDLAKIKAEKFDQIFVKKSKTDSLTEKLIYENTAVNAENNQVFIVTRLPRAAIDSLIN
jgi:hypothetical protein